MPLTALTPRLDVRDIEDIHCLSKAPGQHSMGKVPSGSVLLLLYKLGSCMIVPLP